MDANFLVFHGVVLRGIPGRWACPGLCASEVPLVHAHKQGSSYLTCVHCYNNRREEQMCRAEIGKYKTISKSTDFFSSFFYLLKTG